jgi:GH35 family endo-1,4-beta-xylanase
MNKQITLSVFLILGILSCIYGQSVTYPPTSTITMPYSNSYYKAGSDIEIHVYSTDIGKTTNNGTVAKVEFYNGTTKLGESTTHTNNTYKFVWSCVPAGTYTIKAKATNNRNVTFTSAGVVITVGTSNVTQRGMSACKGKYLANIISGSAQVNYNTYWNGVTAENSCKWGSVEGTRDVMNWNGADVAYNHAKNNKLMFRYHAAVWAAQYPKWILDLSTADARAEVVEYMEAISARYPLIDQIDVLNEQLGNHQADNQKFRNLLGGGSNVSPTDFGWQIWLFEQARRIFPDTKLILNDYGLENDLNAINMQLNLLKALRDRGLVDGFGTQAHCFNIDGLSASALKNALDLMDDAGIPIYVTELDLNGKVENDNNGQQQLSSYQTHFPIYWDHPAVAGITLWGYVNGATWIGGTGLISSSGTEKPALTWLKNYVGGKTSVGYPICATAACNNSKPPVVNLTAPVDKSSFTTLQTITLTATATDSDGNITKVEFYDGSTLLGSDDSAPYSFTSASLQAGTHSLTAKANDNSGLSSTSPVITVTVEAAQAPYKGTPHKIPGKIEAEEYDLGGEGVAYHEENTTGNEGGATLRNDQVDIETTGDITGTYNVGYILKDEWMEYTVNVASTGLYNIELRLATEGTGKLLHIEIDGQNITGDIEVPNTAGWQKWETASLNNISLSQGQHVMRVVFDASYLNINYLEFKNSVTTGITEENTSVVKLYPNPFTNQTNIEMQGSFSYQLINLAGQILEEGEAEHKVQMCESCQKGMYILKIMQHGQTHLIRLTKE